MKWKIEVQPLLLITIIMIKPLARLLKEKEKKHK